MQLPVIEGMTPAETSALLANLYWITLLAVVVSSISGVLKAGDKQFDLFGVVIIAIATGLGGGSLRDMLLDRPVFWIAQQEFFVASLASGLLAFLAARLLVISPRLFLFADAAGLATFGIAGTLVALVAGMPPLIASFMGVMTGVAGGILRDVLCNEHPVVFSSTLYATASWLGSLLFILLLQLRFDVTLSAVLAGGAIFAFRMLAIRYDIGLPRFRTKL